jgi:hypothetical protein
MLTGRIAENFFARISTPVTVLAGDRRRAPRVVHLAVMPESGKMEMFRRGDEAVNLPRDWELMEIGVRL